MALGRCLISLSQHAFTCTLKGLDSILSNVLLVLKILWAREASKSQTLLCCCQGRFYLQECQECARYPGWVSMITYPKLFIFSYLYKKKRELIGKSWYLPLVFMLIGLNHYSLRIHREIQPSINLWQNQTRKDVIPMSHHRPSPQMTFHSRDQLQPLLGAHSLNLSSDKSYQLFLSYRFLSPTTEFLELESPGVGNL